MTRNKIGTNAGPGRSVLVLVLGTVLAFAATAASAADMVLARAGTSEYQIVLPDKAPAGVAAGLQQTARLVQSAFKANQADVPIVHEHDHDAGKPGIFLGATEAARKSGVDVTLLTGWGYVLKVVGRDVIIAGNDQPAPNVGGKPSPTPPGVQLWDRIGTAKAAADFLRIYAGTRFLYPDLGPRVPIGSAGGVDLLLSPAIEYLPTPTISVPADLETHATPSIEYNVSYPPFGSFYDIANNRCPPVDTLCRTHTYSQAVPPEKYANDHPEYFAQINGERLTEGNPQYCISNPAVQELIFQDLLTWIDRGYNTVDVGQPDGFRACQCKECAKLYNTGGDWSEKLWLFNLHLAERLQEARPGKILTLLTYSATETPPKTFKKFPANTRLLLCGSNPEDFAKWDGYEVPCGFSVSIYNWCPNLGTRYTPMRTPRYVEAQAMRFAKYHVHAINRDGAGVLYGLEGPVYYVMGRMYDDPEHNRAKDLVPEFCNAAFGKASAPMLRFYDQLYSAIELYSGFLGTRSPAWVYQTIDGQGRKTVTDPFQLIAFLYTPGVLASLDKELRLAEQTPESEKVAVRLALVRREFDYVRGLARVVHLFHAYQIQPDRPSRDRVLDAIDARNAVIASYYDTKAKPTTAPAHDWSFTPFPPLGHTAAHLRLTYDGYQEPYSKTPLNWNTSAMRDAPLPGEKPAPGTVAPGLFEKPLPPPPDDLDDLPKKK